MIKAKHDKAKYGLNLNLRLGKGHVSKALRSMNRHIKQTFLKESCPQFLFIISPFFLNKELLDFFKNLCCLFFFFESVLKVYSTFFIFMLIKPWRHVQINLIVSMLFFIRGQGLPNFILLIKDEGSNVQSPHWCISNPRISSSCYNLISFFFSLLRDMTF